MFTVMSKIFNAVRINIMFQTFQLRIVCCSSVYFGGAATRKFSCTEFKCVSKQLGEYCAYTAQETRLDMQEGCVLHMCKDSWKHVYAETIVSSLFSRSLGRASVSKVHPLLLMKTVIRP